MSFNTKSLPTSWNSCVSFKLMKPGDRIGYIDTTPLKLSFKLVTAGQAPLSAYAPKMPYECQTLAAIHAANKLTLSVKLNERVWNSFHDLDNEFDKFLLENSAKLFGAAEAEFLRKNPSAISLKRAKRLAPIDPSGKPIYDSILSLRVSGRTTEVESISMADGVRGPYINGVTWAPRIEPLAPSATRFSKITGHTAADLSGSTMPIVRDTLPIFALGDVFKTGSGHVRFVGPGDMATKCIVHHALIRPAYWTNVGGGFMITLSVDHVIFENVEGGDSVGGAEERSGPRALPDGFARDPHEARSDALSTVPMPAAKRRIVPSSVSGESTWGEPASSRNITGGAGGGSAEMMEPTQIGSSSFRALSRSVTGAAGAYEDEEEHEE